MGSSLIKAALGGTKARTDAEPAGFSMTRRTLIIGAPFALAACTTIPTPAPTFAWQSQTPEQMYGPLKDGDITIPPVNLKKIDPQFYRQVVAYSGKEKPGTIIVDPAAHFLYQVQPGGWAVRYGIGVGRAGFAWHGDAIIRFKNAWPKWTPPAEMIDREPRLEKYRKGMPGGLDNPLGARALYLYQGWQDTLYRIHGTNKPETIGHSVSSGCIRMINQDVVDLYSRVPVGTHVVVLGDAVPASQAKAEAAPKTKTPAAKPAATAPAKT